MPPYACSLKAWFFSDFNFQSVQNNDSDVICTERMCTNCNINFGSICIIAAYSTVFKKSSNQVIHNLMLVYTNLYGASAL